MKVNLSEECGNSPKNTFLTKFAIGFATGDVPFVLSSVVEDIRWTKVGQRVIQGKIELAEALAEMSGNPLEELTIDHVVTHGKAGAVNGRMRSANGVTYAFCHMYEFGSAKGASIRAITSYVLETD